MKRTTMQLGGTLLIVAALGAAPGSASAFGVPGAASVPKAPTAPSAPALPSGGGAENIDAFLKAAADANQLLHRSAWAVVQAVTSKEKLAKLVTKRETIEKNPDAKEREAQLISFDSDLLAQLSKADLAALYKQQEGAATVEKRERTAAGVFNLMLAGLRDADLVLQGKQIATTPPSPMIAAKLPQVKSLVTNLIGQGEAIGKLGPGLKKLAAKVGLKDLPLKATDAPKVIPGD